jgi:hypothetical protein
MADRLPVRDAADRSPSEPSRRNTNREQNRGQNRNQSPNRSDDRAPQSHPKGDQGARGDRYGRSDRQARPKPDRSRTQRSGGRQSDRSDDRRRYVLTRDAALELLALWLDEPGDADEDVLDEALESLYEPRALSTSERADASAGLLVCIDLDANDRYEARRSILEDEYDLSPAVADRLVAKVRSQLN